MRITAILLTVLFLAPIAPLTLFTTTDDPVELGRVRWGRDHDAAFARANEAERPVFLLFQEIPG